MNKPNTQDFLKIFEQFNHIDEAVIQKLLDAFVVKEYKKKENLYEPGQDARGMFFMWDGRIRVYQYSDNGKELTKRIVLPGQLIGELCILPGRKRSSFATVIHHTTATLFYISKEKIRALMREDADLLFVITQMIGDKLHRAEQRLESIAFQDARTRIIEFIKMLADDHGSEVGREIVIRTKLTHQDIAKLTATSRQTVTTVLNELKDENLIYFDRQRILVRDYEKL